MTSYRGLGPKKKFWPIRMKHTYIYFLPYLYVSCSGSITSVREERASLSAIFYLWLCGFCSERFPLPLGAWDGLRYFIVTLPEPSI